MARVLRFSASAVALAFIMTTTSAFAQSFCDSANCGENPGNGDGGAIRDARDDRANQRDPVVPEPTEVEDLVFNIPPLFQLPASNAPVTRQSDGQIRSSWAVGVFR